MNTADLITYLKSTNLGRILKDYPIAGDFLANFRLEAISKVLPLPQALEEVEDETLAEFGLDTYGLLQEFCMFLENFTRVEESTGRVSSLTILGGFNKMKEPESVELTIAAGEVISVVGPTGSGKSRLLSDIECLAQRDTPTARQILINGIAPDDLRRFEMGGKLVAQLSQNMNFVMDLTVLEFLEMHAKSRLTGNAAEILERCFLSANELAGEKFTLDTKLTQLSGGQSRALMIADTANMSNSPVILIDEIENAGIDRRQAIKILAKSEKIIKRIVMKNGGISKVIRTSATEGKSLAAIEQIDNTLQEIRNRLRNGEIITEELLK